MLCFNKAADQVTISHQTEINHYCEFCKYGSGIGIGGFHNFPNLILQFEEKGDSRLNLIPPETSLFLSSITGSYVWEGAKKWYFTRSPKPKTNNFLGVQKRFLCTGLQESYTVEQKIAEELLSQESQLDSASAPSY